MTVRQLEALVRLSEAISRSHLETQVLPRHVKVAVKLLKTSIIRNRLLEFQTENDDNNDENATQPVDGEAATAPPDPASDGQAGGGEGSADKQVKKLVITDEEFYRVTQDLIMRHRQHEETAMQEVVC